MALRGHSKVDCDTRRRLLDIVEAGVASEKNQISPENAFPERNGVRDVLNQRGGRKYAQRA
jgi:hypothetical protein